MMSGSIVYTATKHSLMHLPRFCRRCSAKLRYSTSWQVEQRSSSKPTSTKHVFTNIRKVLNTESLLLKDVAQYHFNGLGKAVRPKLVLAAAQAFNLDSTAMDSCEVSEDQLVVAMVAEMIHTASLIHDDVIDESLSRRGNPSVFALWGQLKAAYTGDYVLSSASVALSRLRHNRVMKIMSQILEDLVQGEFMQLGTKANEDERFNHYIEKSYRKTASLLANSCKAAAVLANTTEDKIELAFQYGRNIGILFQLIDDALDYESTEKEMGKPTGADLRLGLATAPVLFAAHEFPRLNTLILRRFSNRGDVEEALNLVKQSSGLEQTRILAQRYGHEAISVVSKLKESEARDSLITFARQLLDRTK